MRTRLVAAAAAAGAAAVLTAGGPAATVRPCTAPQLSGTFAVIPGSAGAGSIYYSLRLRNRSGRTCFVSGLPGLRLLDRARRPLPTRVEPAFRPALAAARIVLRPGRAAKATARFSPDIPGPGEPQRGPCERTAYWVRVTPPPAGGALVARVSPPTTVCVGGHISLTALSPA